MTGSTTRSAFRPAIGRSPTCRRQQEAHRRDYAGTIPRVHHQEGQTRYTPGIHSNMSMTRMKSMKSILRKRGPNRIVKRRKQDATRTYLRRGHLKTLWISQTSPVTSKRPTSRRSRVTDLKRPRVAPSLRSTTISGPWVHDQDRPRGR